MADIHINAGGLAGAPLELLLRAIELVMGSQAVAEGEVSLTLLDDKGIRELNRQYLKHDCVTDVIAFNLSDEGGPLSGDVYIGFEQAARQASELGISTDDELARLAIHGVLHVLGSDHPVGKDRFESPMWRLQEELLNQLLDGDT